MVRKILVALLAVFAIFLVLAAMQPSEFNVSRSTTIAAAASDIFPHINDHHAMQVWSPWAKKDPDATYTFEGPESGVGAIARWDGNMEIGKGTSTIVESVADERVKYQLDFEKPMQGTATSEIALAPADGGTRVTWSMTGHNNYIAKVMSLVMNCEEMIATEFDKGLTDLKTLVESQEAAVPTVEETSDEAAEDEAQEVAPAPAAAK